MPLTKAGRRVMRKMMEQYGIEKGKEVFYAKENSDEKFAKAVANKKKQKGKDK